MPQGPEGTSPLMKPFVVLALPGMYLFYKYSQYKRRRKENQRRKLTEKELQHLNNKIEKLLSQLEENEPELATSQEEECVICIHAKATMLTSPCGHQVVCRKCFVKTIQIAVSQRLLPLRCVICRAKILRLKTGPLLPTSASGYSVTSRTSVPASDSLYSVSSGGSSLSSCSSTAGEHAGPCCGGRCMGARPRQPSGALRRSQQQAMKARLQDYTIGQRGRGVQGVNRLPVIRESSPSGGTPPPSTRIRCAQKIVTQLESTTTKNGYKYAKLPQDDLDADGDAFQLGEVKKPARTPEKDKQWPARTPDKEKHWWSRSKSEEKVDNRRNELTERQMLLKEMAGGKGMGKACSVGDDRV